MAPTRLLAKLVSVTGSLSSGAVRRVAEGDRARGLEVVTPLLALLSETLSTSSTPPAETKRAIAAILADLIDRYGTARRVMDAIGSNRRRVPSIAGEKAHAWEQVMAVGPGAIEQTLKRHAGLHTHLSSWLGTHPEIENKLDEFLRWLDAPIDAAHPHPVGTATSTAGSTDHGAGVGALTGEPKKVVAPMASPNSPLALEDDDSGHTSAVGASHSDVDALAVLEDSSEQAKIAGEGSRDLKLIRLFVLHDKHPGEEPADRHLTDEQRAAIERLRKDHDQYARAVGAVAARDFMTADGLLPYLDNRVEPVLLQTLRGDRYYFESRYDEALPLFRKAKSLRDDSVTRLNVAVTLLRAARGSLEENFKEALDLLTDTALALGEGTREWARVRCLLGLAWAHTPTGSREKNITEAIKCFESAANALKRETDAQWWAETQLHLGRAWIEFPTGDRAANLAAAMRCFEHAGQVWTKENDPHHWAVVANCVAHAHERNPLGDRRRNLELALKCYNEALSVREQEHSSALWAVLQNNIGNVYMQLPGDDHRASVEKAIECYTKALEVYTRENRRMEWAATQNNLGNAYAHLPTESAGVSGEDRQKNLRRAIACYKAALEVRTKSLVPAEWATTQNNLGVALSLLTPQKNDANLHEAVQCYQHALEVRTRQNYPIDWATTQSNMGRAYARMAQANERADNLQEAVAYFQNALEVFTPEAHPNQHQLVSARLKDVKQAVLDMGRRG